MRTAVGKWGNSLALRLPRELTAEMNLREGSPVELTIQNDAIVITPTRPRYKLSELLANLKTTQQHVETDWGEEKGKEAW